MATRWALIGYGGMGGWHVEKLRTLPEFEIAGIYDIKPEQVKAAEEAGLAAYESLEALLGEPGRDISLRTPLVSWVLTQLMGYWDYFKKNQSLRLLLEGSCKEALSHLLAGHRHLIGEVAVHALDRLSAERLNRLVEEKVGEDLAWIRINGSLVGGIIGFCLFWMLEALR